jgi:hypothetical protein
MWINAMIADWPQLLRHLETHGPDVTEVDSTWYHGDPFTR